MTTAMGTPASTTLSTTPRHRAAGSRIPAAGIHSGKRTKGTTRAVALAGVDAAAAAGCGNAESGSGGLAAVAAAALMIELGLGCR